MSCEEVAVSSGPLVYLAGPITGVKDYKASFGAAEKAVSAVGFRVTNPARNKRPSVTASWQDWMRLSLQQVSEARIVALLPEWEHSKGAVFEKDTAERLGIPTYTVAVLVEQIIRGDTPDRLAQQTFTNPYAQESN